MTKLIHPYSLQAFPTEKILKEFKPVRGCHVHGKIELPPGQAELLWASPTVQWISLGLTRLSP